MRLTPCSCRNADAELPSYSAHTQFRKAQLQAKRNAENARRKERELLFAGVHEGSNAPGSRRKGHEKLSQDEVLVNASSDVTAALRRTHQLMQNELSRSQFAHDTLRMHYGYTFGRCVC